MRELNEFEDLKDEIQKLNEQLDFFKQYDILTGLYNKGSFENKTKEVLSKTKEQYSIVCVDIEKFKVINDLYGSENGDKLLKHLAEHFYTFCKKHQGIASRFASDIYMICLPSKYTEKIINMILKLFRSLKESTEITPAIGVYDIEDSNFTVSFMCDNALLAITSIKGNFQKHWAHYNVSMRAKMVLEQEMVASAAEALQCGQFQFYLQPKCDMSSGKIIGCEALVRWMHPEKGIIPPNDFIPLFERNGFIKELDVYIWEEVIRWLKDLEISNIRALPVSVNVSRIDMLELDVFSIITNLTNKYNVDPSLLKLEVTESAYINEEEKIIKIVDQLRRYGFNVLLDDFGSGYSSLNILKDINIDALKLDMRFLDKKSQKSKDVLLSIQNMAKWLNLITIAEGVETYEQVEFLLAIGCRLAQGYYYYRPMDVNSFNELLKDKDKIDYTSLEMLRTGNNNLFNIKELFYENVVSNNLLNNVLGCISLIYKENDVLYFEKGNAKLLELLKIYDYSIGDKEVKKIFSLSNEDYENMLKIVNEATSLNDEGADITLRCIIDDLIYWIKFKFFFLSRVNDKEMYYAAISDVSEDTKLMDELTVSEQLFAEVMEFTNTVIFELDIENKTARYAKHVQGAFSLDDVVTKAPEGFIEQGTVCEDSIQDFKQLYEEIYGGADESSKIIHAMMNGKEVYNKIMIKAIKNAEGKTIKAVGVVHQVD